MRKQALLIVLLALHAAGVQGQQIVPSLTGTDFWVAFITNIGSGGRSLLIASEENCTAYIECQSPLYSDTVTIQSNRITRVSLPGILSYSRGIHVTTTAPAVVYASNYVAASHDITAVLPTSGLRCNYVINSPAHGFIAGGRELAIVAPYEDTQIDVSSFWGYVINHFTPSRGEVVYVTTGPAKIHSTRPVAVFEGYSCACIPSAFGACDHVYEQLYPTEYWGRRFMVVPTRERSPYMIDNQPWDFIGDMVMVTSSENNCVVNIGGGPVATLSAGETYFFLVANHPPDTVNYTTVNSLNLDFYQSDALYIETSKPASTCFYISGIMFGGSPGDPASVIVPPLEQGVSHTVVAAYNSTLTQNHYVNLVAPTSDVSLITLDGRSIASNFTPTAEGYSWACLTVDTGTHIIDADGGRFQATFYGLGDAECYAYIAGTAVRNSSYDVRADQHYLCPGGDTVTITVRHDSTIYHTEWQLDGQPIGTDVDTMRLFFDSAGVYRVRVVITPGDTVWEVITVNPDYDIHVADSICPRDTLYWNGQALFEEGTYTAYLNTLKGCDSIVTMDFSMRTTKYFSSADTICPHDSLHWQGWVLTEPGIYIDTMITADGCDSILTLQLSMFDAPQADMDLDVDCAHYSYRILSFGRGDTTGYTIRWQASPPDPALEGQPWDSLSLSPSTPTTYHLSIAGRCPFDTSFTLHPIRWPVAEMVVRPEVISVDHLDFEAYDKSQNANNRYWWVDGQSAGSDPVLSYRANALEDSLLLTLVAVNEACADTLTRMIPIVHTAVWAPNVFTPGGPDNNLFAPVLDEAFAEELFVYNREGLLVARIVGDNPSWNGTHNGTPCSQGAYVWVLFYRTNNNPAELQKDVGTVLLLK